MRLEPILLAELDWLETWALSKKGESNRPDDAAFESFEVELYTSLWSAWNEALKELSKDMPLEEFERFVGTTLGAGFAVRVRPSVSGVIVEAYFFAKESMSKELGISPLKSEYDYRMIQFLQEYNNFWIGRYYDEQLRQMVTDIIRRGMEEGLTTAKIGDRLQQILSGKLEPEKLPPLAKGQYPWMYWRGLAGNAITRARNAAYISSLEEAGVEKYEIRAVLDGRTCPICRSMHGRVVPVKVGRENVDAFSRLRDPASVKEKFPWPKSVFDVALPTGKLKTHQLLPPFHFNCRCTFVPYFDSFEVEARRLLEDEEFQRDLPGKLLVRSEAEAWKPKSYDEALRMIRVARKDDFTKKEIGEFLREAEWREGAFEKHLEKHLKSFEKVSRLKMTPKRYERIVRRVLRDGEVWGVIDTNAGVPQLWVIAPIKDDRNHVVLAVVNLDGTIRTVHPRPASLVADSFKKNRLEMAYKIREGKEIVLKSSWVRKMRWTRDAVKGFAEAYLTVLQYDLPKAYEDEDVYYDAPAALGYRYDVVNHLDLADEETLQILKKGDEMILEDLNRASKAFGFWAELHEGKPSLHWTHYLDWIREGKMEVVWDEERKLYVGRLKRK